MKDSFYKESLNEKLSDRKDIQFEIHRYDNMAPRYSKQSIIDELMDAGYSYKEAKYIANHTTNLGESLNEKYDESLEKEIFEYLDEFDGHTDYNQMVEDVAEDFDLDKDTAENYVWNWTLEYRDEDEDEDEWDEEDDDEEELDEARYSDNVPKEERGWWYFTTHGVQPGSIPKDLNVLDIKDGKNSKGTLGTFVKLDGILNTDELKKFDMIEDTPKELVNEDLKDDIKDLLISIGGYNDYNGKVEEVADEFGLSKEEAEGYVWDILSDPDFDDEYHEYWDEETSFEEDDSLEDDYLYGYDDAVSFIQSEGFDPDPNTEVGEYICDLLDEYASENEQYSMEDIEDIIDKVKEKFSMEESLNEASKLDIIKSNKEDYAELENKIKSMPDGIEKDISIEMGLKWIKGNN